MNMLISGVSEKDGKKVAYVSFEDGKRIAEGIIPDCNIIRNDGFADEEVEMLKEYLKDNLETIKREAAGINPIKAMMKE